MKIILDNDVKCKLNAARYIKLITNVLKLGNRDLLHKESHHIIPKSMGGTDESTNLIDLTLREHYIAHKLLFKTYKNISMACAMNMMRNKGSCNSRKYEQSKLTNCNFNYTDSLGIDSQNNFMISKCINKNHILSGNNNGMYGKVVARNSNGDIVVVSKEEFKSGNYVGQNKGIKVSELTRKKLSEAKSGSNNPIYGKKLSEETKKKIAAAHIGFKHSEETKEKLRKYPKFGALNSNAKKVSINGIIYDTLKDAAASCSRTGGTVSFRCKSAELKMETLVFCINYIMIRLNLCQGDQEESPYSAYS